MPYVLADVVSECVVEAPIEELDLAYWVYAMSDRDYRNCARGHYGCGSSPLPGGERSSINAECVGGHLLVQHYEPYEAEAAKIGWTIPERPIMRSVFVAERLGAWLAERTSRIDVRHRELQGEDSGVGPRDGDGQ